MLCRVGDCLFNNTATINYPTTIQENITSQLPGEVYSEDDRCYMFYGTGVCTKLLETVYEVGYKSLTSWVQVINKLGTSH